MKCPVCDNEIIYGAYSKRIINKRYNAEFLKCLGCGSYIRVNYDLNKILNQYELDSNIRIASWHQMSTESASRYWMKLQQVIPNEINKKGSLFEFGTSLGYFLNHAKQNGWIVSGIEWSQIAVDYAKEKFNIDITKGSIEKYDCLIKFDMIAAFEVIEHLENPVEILSRCYYWLKPQGILVISTPNVDSPSADFSESETYHCGHLVLFGYKKLKEILEKMGFEVVKPELEIDLQGECLYNGDREDDRPEIFDDETWKLIIEYNNKIHKM